MLKDRKMRVRKLTIEPGGIVPWHSHGDRPALIYIIEGEINEYASNCAAPIVHTAGDVAAETHEVAHWWKNLGNRNRRRCSRSTSCTTRTITRCDRTWVTTEGAASSPSPAMGAAPFT